MTSSTTTSSRAVRSAAFQTLSASAAEGGEAAEVFGELPVHLTEELVREWRSRLVGQRKQQVIR